MPYKNLSLLLLLLVGLSSAAVGQSDTLTKIEQRLRTERDPNNLHLLSPFLNKTQEVEERLGYHQLQTPQKDIAARLIMENTLFASEGLIDGKKLNANTFEAYLKKHQVRWVDTLEAYVAGNWRSEGVAYEVRGITAQQWLDRKADFTEGLGSRILANPNLRTLWDAKDPRILPEIAAELFKDRHRFHPNSLYHGSPTWLEYLVHFQVAVLDGSNKFAYDLKWDYTIDGRLHLLNFWLEHYQSFKWNGQLGYFESAAFPLPGQPEEVDLFPLLDSEDDSAAHRAFMRLAVGNPDVVPGIALERDKHSFLSDANTSLGSFPFRFLQQLPLLADFCRKHGISYEGSTQLKDWERRMLACKTERAAMDLLGEMLAGLQQADVSALELWAATHQTSWQGQWIVGRVLDEYYSNHWQEIVADTAELELYLRKSHWFENLGIVGYAYVYLNKFRGQPETVLQQLDAIHTQDQVLLARVDSAKKYLKMRPSAHWPGRITMKRAPHPADLHAAWDAELHNPSKKDLEFRIGDVIAGISYDQIDEAIELLAADTLLNYFFPGQRYDFLERDFGLPVEGDSMLDADYRADFLVRYRALSEQDLYLHYLGRLGLNILLPDGSLNYPRVNNLLEFGLSHSFVGGSSGLGYRQVYAVIKVLELRHGTRLGHWEKLCGYGVYTHCSPREQAQDWMEWLVKNGKVVVDPDRPHSFGYEY